MRENKMIIIAANPRNSRERGISSFPACAHWRAGILSVLAEISIWIFKISDSPVRTLSARAVCFFNTSGTNAQGYKND